ncbi:sulfatase family protein [Nocardioides bruguierae]|uniref:Sulfatase n=1 Tax=Nocardioides bruguierae TaxID=2945102 RepID=A0A9X2D9P1_9ACTN|nr:sulfatase [Nocardioides bruguierae]MCM0621362.1 sulfatase [Nocardioides bruguierae]
MRIIYIDVDTLRADHTTPYGYHRDTTPNLQALADRGVTFDRYYGSDSPCLPSRTALYSSQFGITNGVIGHFGDAARYRLDSGHAPHPTRPLFGQLLQAHGTYTAAVSMFAERHRAYYFLGNFRETIRATGELNDEDGADINRVGLDWIRRHADEDDWYLHLTYWEPHTPYLADPSWTRKAAESGPVQEWPDAATIEAHQEVYGPRTARDLHYAGFPLPSPVPSNMPEQIGDRADFEHLINGFDGSIMYWDSLFGELLATLDELGIAEETAIIVSADHGESLGEMGSYAEHGNANEPVHRLPLVMYWPGVTDDLPDEARHRDEMLYNIDLAPTLCEMLDIAPGSGWQGRSFAAAISGGEIEDREYLVLGHGAHTYQRAVRTREHLYVRTYHPGANFVEWESLYHVPSDPHLTENLLDKEPVLANEMRAHLTEWWNELAGRPGALPDPMQTTLQTGPTYYNDPVTYAQHLRDTGRAHLADDLMERLAAASGATPVSWHAQEPSWTPERHHQWARMIFGEDAEKEPAQ